MVRAYLKKGRERGSKSYKGNICRQKREERRPKMLWDIIENYL